AQRLKNCVREADTVARIGGDEFVILLRDTDADGGARVAQNMLKSIEAAHTIDDLQIFTHASIGISVYPSNAQDVEKLIKYADTAMYRAKEEGRSTFQFFAAEMNLRSNLLFSLEKDLRLALERNEFSLHYQAQADIASGKICGAEALLRWKHPEKGLILPAEFIPVAEDTGQIVPIGEWVLRTACMQLTKWRRQGMAAFPLAVNLSVRQLRQSDLASIIAGIIKEAGLQPCDLELEITEGMMMSYAQPAMAFLENMSKLGVQLSIDDFGTGFSCLSYLKKLPVNKLKIDQSFVHDIEVDESDDAIVRSVIGLGHQFQLRVIAEGVETKKQLDFLRANGCDEIQGYYLSHPLPADEFIKFIHGNPMLEQTPTTPK
ncbi:MAG TPA: bifunctional diguanylate cyclase/phosphodiesterase, partial [Methylophilaceae bacterium]|nr:bifunctional diguanylate cyclase/phosphodiesterase [Methylophilaceae bacterium]